jgi:hypothetical protein
MSTAGSLSSVSITLKVIEQVQFTIQMTVPHPCKSRVKGKNFIPNSFGDETEFSVHVAGEAGGTHKHSLSLD